MQVNRFKQIQLFGTNMRFVTDVNWVGRLNQAFHRYLAPNPKT